MAVRQNKKNGRWIADYRDPDGKRHQMEFRLKREADSHLTEVNEAKRQGLYVDPAKAKSVTVGMAWAKWMERVRVKGARRNRSRTPAPKTIEDYEFNYAHYIKPSWEYTPLSNISVSGVNAWVDTMQTPDGRPASNYAKDRAVDYFVRLLDDAVAEGWLASNPARDRAGGRIATPEVERSKTQVRLTLAQLVRLAACAGEWRTFILFTGLTGLRWGEVSTLRRKHFEFGETPTVVVEKAVSKTRKQRIVPVPRDVAALVEKELSASGGEALAFPSPTGKTLDGKNFANRYYRPAGKLASTAVASLQDALGVTDSGKRIQSGDTFQLVAAFGPKTSKAMHEFQKAQGITVGGETTPDFWQAIGLPELRDVTLVEGDVDFLAPTFHNLRHTAVSLAISAGANIKLVQRIAGHSSATMTLDVYSELFDDDLHDSARRLNENLRNVAGFSSGK